MAIERSETPCGHWRTILLWEVTNEGFSILSCFDQCIHCSFETQPGDVSSRRRQMTEHERTHPREREVQDLHRFREELNCEAARLCPHAEIEAFQWTDCEHWPFLFKWLIAAPEYPGPRFDEFVRRLFAKAKEWQVSR
jgi:hypothetical protein